MEPHRLTLHKLRATVVTLTAIVVVTMLGACGGKSSTPVAGTNIASIPACGTDRLFSVSPVAYSEFTGLEPLGHLNPSGHTFPTDHIYFNFPESHPGGPPVVTTVRMPGDAWITEVRVLEHLSAIPPYSDYSIRFQPCDEYFAYFNHLQSIEPALAAELTGSSVCETRDIGGEQFRECNYSLNRKVTAGTVVGTGGGQTGQRGVDFGAIDLRQAPLQWANQARIVGSDPMLPYTTCPIDEFEPAVRSVLEARFSNGDGTVLRTTAPYCGTIAQDVAGTAQGIWLSEGATSIYPEDPNIALVHDNVDPAQGAFSIGPPLDGTGPRVFLFAPSHAGLDNREFSEVTNDGQIYCYGPIVGGSMLVKLETPTRLLAEFRQNVPCSDGPYAFAPDPAVFVR